MYLPQQWPSYFASARGTEVTDLDGKTYIDMSMMGIGACVLGYADPDVDRAVKSAIDVRLYTESFPDLELVAEQKLNYLENDNVDSIFLLRRK
ncbi:MAG: hypothetical protein WB566_05315 [Terriglobales bacterium]